MFDTPFPEIHEAPAAAPEVAAEVVDRAQIINGTPLVKYSATEAGLIALKAELAGKVYDLKTTKGDQAARADRLRCVTLRTTLEKRRKDFKAPALAYGKLIDTEAARITAEIEALEAPIDAQIRADEKRRQAEKEERERIEREAAEKHAARRAAISMYALRSQEPGMTAERIAAGMQRLQGADMSDPDNARAVDLADLQCRTLETMRTLHAQAVAREAEAARQEAIRIENERVAAELAAERQRIAAEAEAIRRQAAELEAQRAESARLEALAVANRAAQAAMTYPNGAPMFSEQIKENGDRVMLDDQGKRSIFCDVDEGTTEGQHPGQVLKAEPATADATDPGAAATASPCVGTMGAGQAADAAPAGVRDEPATLTLGVICERLGVTIRAEFLADTLHVKPAATPIKGRGLYTERQFATICRQLQSHVSAMAELYAGVEA